MNAFRLVLIGLASFVLAALGWRLTAERAPQPAKAPAVARIPSLAIPRFTAGPPAKTGPAPAGETNRERPEARAPVETPEFTPFYARLRGDFPHSYALLVQPAADDAGAAGPDAAIWNALRALQQSHGLLAARAGAAELQAYFDSRLNVLDALAPEDPRTCADFLYGIAGPSFAGFTGRHRALVAALASSQLGAIETGRDRPVDRAPPGTTDFDLLAAGLTARALSPDEISVLLDGKTLDPPIPDARLCEMGRIYLSVLRTLPDEARDRIYSLAAELLARS